MRRYDIIIVTDFEEGHVFPLFKMADNLINNGFTVCFVGIPDTMEIVKKHGFDHYAILDGLFPKGYVHDMKKNQVKTNSISTKYYLGAFFDELEVLMPALNPRLVFSSHFFVLEALIIHYRYGLPQIIFHLMLPSLEGNANISLGQRTYYRCMKKIMDLHEDPSVLLMKFFGKQDQSLKSFDEIVSPLKTMPQVMLCPQELDLGKADQNNKDIYLGPCINHVKNEDHSSFLSSIKAQTGKKIIFASMGSQTKEYQQNALKFFNSIVKAMRSAFLQDFHLVLSLGSETSNVLLDDIPPNVSVFSWVPQLEVLQRASLAIIHGGLGSVKECIYFGVPMLIIPMGRDQMDNARRIEHHNIGLSLGIDQVSSDTLEKKIQTLFTDGQIKSSLLRMKMLFQKANRSTKEAEVVRILLESSPARDRNISVRASGYRA